MTRWTWLSLVLLAGCSTTYQPLPVAEIPGPLPVSQEVSIPTPTRADTWSARLAPSELIEPSSGNFIEFPWYDRAVYVIYTAPERPTTLVFGPKEEWRYTSQVGERWQMEEMTRDLPFHIVITPQRADATLAPRGPYQHPHVFSRSARHTEAEPG